MRIDYHSFVVFVDIPYQNRSLVVYMVSSSELEAVEHVLSRYVGSEIRHIEETELTYEQFCGVMDTFVPGAVL